MLDAGFYKCFGKSGVDLVIMPKEMELFLRKSEPLLGAIVDSGFKVVHRHGHQPQMGFDMKLNLYQYDSILKFGFIEVVGVDKAAGRVGQPKYGGLVAVSGCQRNASRYEQSGRPAAFIKQFELEVHGKTLDEFAWSFRILDVG